MRSFFVRLMLGAFIIGVLPLAASAGTAAFGPNGGTTAFGPSDYLQLGDTPDGFCSTICGCDVNIETFEDGMLDSFLSIDNGDIFPPNGTTGTNQPITDSVDGDDGSVDGSGLAGYSWYTGSVQDVTITFASSVTCAGLVFTDADASSSNVSLEAFDSNGVSLGIINAGDLADGSNAGETAEDAFLGFHNADGEIAWITLSIDAGSGIELDHIHWADCAACVPEPAASAMAFFGLLGLFGWRRRR